MPAYPDSLCHGGDAFRFPLGTMHGERAEMVFEIDASEYTGDLLELVLAVNLAGRHTSTPVMVRLLRDAVI